MRTGLNILAAASAANGASTGRDQRRLGVLFLMPVAIMAIIGIAMGGYSEPSLVVGVLDRAGTGASRDLISAIAANQHMRIHSYTDQEKMRIAVFRGRLNAGVIIPSGWSGAGDLDVYLSQASSGSPVIRAAIDADLSRLANRAKPFAIPGSISRRRRGGKPAARISIYGAREPRPVRDDQRIGFVGCDTSAS